MELTCYVYPGWAPRIRAASSNREWMDATPERFAYRCLPLNIANSHGWEILSPCGFEAEWNGGSRVEDVTVRPDPGTAPHVAPVALFGQGTFTFHVEGLFRTPEGTDLWVGGSPNRAKDGVAPLGGIIETDWAPYTFTMNWRLTRPGHVIRFEENEPFCFFFPVDRRLIESVEPRIAPIEEHLELKRQFEEWSASRDAFQLAVAENRPVNPSEKWQKYYYRGLKADGSPGAPDHRSKLRLKDFAGSEHFHRETPAAPSCPVAQTAREPEARPQDGRSADKNGWILSSLERLRSMAPRRIPCRTEISREEFLAAHYAANFPVVLQGAARDWPAVQRWNPDYLKEAVGAQIVEVQSGRASDEDFERNMDGHRTAMPFADFIEQIRRLDAANDVYMTAYNSGANQAAMAALHADLGFLDQFLSPDAEARHGMAWIGPAGTFTPLHHDLTNNLFLQLVGRKQLLLVAPGQTPRLYNDYHVYSRIRDISETGLTARFPDLDGVHVHQVILQPGDALFIPLGWWHQVTALDFSVSVTHTNFIWPNDFYQDHPS
jgi:hypothetical protein